MLKRISLLNNKNKLKSELDRTLNMIRCKLEMTLKQQNKRHENDFIELKDLKPDKFVFKAPNDLKELIKHFRNDLADWIKVNNEYVKCKIGEEKAKAKRPKMSDADFEATLLKRHELVNYETEIDSVLK